MGGGGVFEIAGVADQRPPGAVGGTELPGVPGKASDRPGDGAGAGAVGHLGRDLLEDPLKDGGGTQGSEGLEV